MQMVRVSIWASLSKPVLTNIIAKHSTTTLREVMEAVVAERGVQFRCSNSVVHRALARHNIILHGRRHRPADDAQLVQALQAAVARSGYNFGRRLMSGQLRADGFNVSEWKVGQLQRRLNPQHVRLRILRRGMAFKSARYRAPHFGQI
jgi:hypothetical protein